MENEAIRMVQLKFRVDPDYLKNRTEVLDPVKVVFLNPDRVFALGILGESGRTMVLDGAVFEFEREQAEWMISQGIAALKPLLAAPTPSPLTQVCGQCSGKGKWPAQFEPTGWMICPTCQGTGTIPQVSEAEL